MWLIVRLSVAAGSSSSQLVTDSSVFATGLSRSSITTSGRMLWWLSSNRIAASQSCSSSWTHHRWAMVRASPFSSLANCTFYLPSHFPLPRSMMPLLQIVGPIIRCTCFFFYIPLFKKRHKAGFSSLAVHIYYRWSPGIPIFLCSSLCQAWLLLYYTYFICLFLLILTSLELFCPLQAWRLLSSIIKTS